MKKDGGWVFISHSHLDIEVVRKIRNQLEACGFEPLMFYLKCLNDDDEIESLIRREIDEREWFIYVESENALNSRWVRSEREYISQLSGKKIFTIDINKDIAQQVNKITRQLKVFISCSSYDREIFETIKKALVKRDFLVYDPFEMPVGNDWLLQMRDALDETVQNGFALLLISEHTKNNAYMKKEIDFAFEAGGKIVPVFIGNATLGDGWDPRIRELQGIYLDEFPTTEQVESVISHILHRIDYYDSDFSVSWGFRGAKTIKYPYVAAIPDYTFWDCDNLETVYIPDCVSYISDIAFRNDQDVLIICSKGSYAEQYSIRNNIRYKIKEQE
ncbi:MAG: TIR domain-containing protein [Lachnospiraceae bacterium]|nr:TIR domain-containing protein [Lachnospiraceae bacterium]